MIAKEQGHELPSVNVELRAHKGKQLRGKSKHFLLLLIQRCVQMEAQ